ncbi:MAG: hypothetical protein ACKO3T_10660 [Planctomycetaceae bacterium]
MDAVLQLLDKLENGAKLSGDDIIALLLVSAMLLSLGHLGTMLATRWGDRHTAAKSLMGSILIHFVCLLGLEVFDPSQAPPADPRQQIIPPAEVLTEVLPESDRDVLQDRAGNVPLVDRPTLTQAELLRFETAAPILEPPETPERTPETPPANAISAADVTQFEPAPATELAPLAEAGQVGPRQVAAASSDPAGDLSTTYESSQADLPATQLSRQRSRPGLDTEMPPPERAAVAAAPATALQIQAAELSLSAALDDSPTAVPLPAAMEDNDQIEKPVAPQLSDSFAAGAPVGPAAPAAQPDRALTVQSRLPRPARRLPDPAVQTRPARIAPETAQTPLPLNSQYEDVRLGSTAPEFADSLLSAGEIMVAELPSVRRRPTPPAAYGLRGVEARQKATEVYGGSRQSEDAVERSLRWLARVQSPDGHWDASDYGAGQVDIDENGVDRDFAGREADAGLTALTVLCFLGAGYTHEQGRYAIQVDQALDWLIQQQTADGCLAGNAEHYARMYCHAMATYALAEACGMQKDIVLGSIVEPDTLAIAFQTAKLSTTTVSGPAAASVLPMNALLNETTLADPLLRWSWQLRRVDDIRLRSALAKAVTFTIGQQDPASGGWRYRQFQEGDVSMFGWHLMSLKSAEMAGVTVPEQVRTRMQAFLKNTAQGTAGGLYGYRRSISGTSGGSEPPTPVMTAEALFCRQMLGAPPDSPATREAVGFLGRNPPSVARTDFYYWYYGTLAMHQHGGAPWRQWNSMIRDLLIAEQRTSGELAGTWDPNDPWGRYGGRLYSTALATLTLEVYYRFLPTYQISRPASTTPTTPP